MLKKETKPLTDDQIMAIAGILTILGAFDDWSERIDVAAIAIKVGIFEADNPRYWELQDAAGIKRRAS